MNDYLKFPSTDSIFKTNKCGVIWLHTYLYNKNKDKWFYGLKLTTKMHMLQYKLPISYMIISFVFVFIVPSMIKVISSIDRRLYI